MTQEAKVRVRLDTSLAKSALKELNVTAHTVSSRIGGAFRAGIGAGAASSVGGFVGGAVGGFAAGAIGSGLANLRGPSQGTLSALSGDMFGALATQLEMAVFGKAGPEAKAATQAREWAVQTFGFNTRTEEDRTRILPYFENRKQVFQKFETGRQAIEGDTRFYAHAMPGTDMIGRFAEVLGKVMKDAVQELINGIKALWPFG